MAQWGEVLNARLMPIVQYPDPQRKAGFYNPVLLTLKVIKVTYLFSSPMELNPGHQTY